MCNQGAWSTISFGKLGTQHQRERCHRIAVCGGRAHSLKRRGFGTSFLDAFFPLYSNAKHKKIRFFVIFWPLLSTSFLALRNQKIILGFKSEWSLAKSKTVGITAIHRTTVYLPQPLIKSQFVSIVCLNALVG